MVIHLDAVSRRRSSDLPIRIARITLDCLILLQAGFTWLPTFPQTPVVSYTTLSPLLLLEYPEGAVCFLLHLPFPVLTGTLLFRGALSCGVRTFLHYHLAGRPFYQPQLFILPLHPKTTLYYNWSR